MDQNKKLLQEMYKSMQMGCENIADVIPRVEDKFMLGVLTNRLEEFGNYAEKVSDMMHQHGYRPKELSMMAKMGSKMGIATNTLLDASPAHIAELFVKGSEMGIQKLEDTQRQLSGTVDVKVTSLCNEIISAQRRDNKKMEAFI